jgi:hypothetical protein
MKRGARGLLLSLCKAALIAYLVVCLAAWVFQSRLVYFPGGPPRVTPALLGLLYRDVQFSTRDGVKLAAWLVEAPRPRGIALHCHGNAGSIEERVEHARALVDLGLSVLLFDYRGYGSSEGSPSEEGTYLDAEAAWDFVTKEAGFSPESVIAWGESLGGAVAIELTGRRPLRALVTEMAFTSVPELGAHHYRWLPVRWLARIRYDNLAKVAQLRLPWLLLHSPRDEIVPFAQGERLLAAAQAARANVAGASPVELVRTRGGHNDGGFLFDEQATAALARFLDQQLGPLR